VWQRGECRWALGAQYSDQLCGDLAEFTFIGVTESCWQLGERHPSDFVDLVVIGTQLAIYEPQQIMVHGLVHYPVLGLEPVFADAERSEDFAVNAGFFGDFADRGLFCSFADFDVAFRYRPAFVTMTGDGPYQCDDRDVTVEAIDDQSTGRILVHGAQATDRTAAGPTAAPPGSSRVASRLSHRTT